jgi:hypothetical protein
MSAVPSNFKEFMIFDFVLKFVFHKCCCSENMKSSKVWWRTIWLHSQIKLIGGIIEDISINLD